MYRPLLICCLLSLPSVAQVKVSNDKNTLPEIGVVASNAISIDKELQIGQALMRQLRSRAPLVGDPLLEEYIQDLGNRLVAQADNAKFPFKFFLIANKEINAFAFFGGHVAVHTGLIIEADTESELASVIGHEIAHVTQRHIARSIEAQQKASPLQLVSALGGILLAMSNPEAGIAAISAGSAAAQQAAINYTRSNEKEADRVGIDILYRAGYDPAASANFFGKLAAKYRHQSKPPAFLMTHPLPESRVADVRARQSDYPDVNLGPSLSFQLVKARLQARYGENQELNIQRFRDWLKEARHPVTVQAAKYGLALSLLATEKLDEAEMLISELRQEAPENLFYLDTFTDIAIEKKQYQQAIEALQAQSERQPRNRVLVLNLANALIKNKQHDEAVRLLKDYLLVNPEHLLTYQLLTDAYGESRKMMEMHQTKAELYALVAAYPRAIDELQTAYNYTAQSTLEKQRIRARIEQLREEENRLKSL
ncbi:M48 family metalloprotease [Aliiglaciecola sp. CAU 1673]|uniref:beta-barrel assembly-enhancing protease n=1 Tax=Aliiglaciecola sp. CAU 1673 TaxID=3032595 RepID=UPI0023DA2D66|nr:M48 family metalloprotease [Aliiglaciecola sp. CAU 1673]MDF2177559.1 M48 family metalloprotease [Aliiglaciecola sp. CAU 1673]